MAIPTVWSARAAKVFESIPLFGGWVESVVRFGWVSNVINFFVQPPLFALSDDPQVDVDGREHAVVAFGDPCEQSEQQLNTSYEPLVQLLRGLGLSRHTAEAPLPPIWLDIDLDFAVPNVSRRGSKPREPEALFEQLSKPMCLVAESGGRTTLDLLHELFRIAKLITIATEPEYSGGFAGVSTVLRGLRHCFPDHRAIFTWFGED